MNTTPQDALRSYEATLLVDYGHPAPALAAPSGTPRLDRLRTQLTPLHERLRAALAKFPPDAIADGVHMDQLWPLCIGIQRQKPRAFEVANALRALGWTRVRIYSDGTQPSGTYWFPPEVTPQNAKAAAKGRK